jgi:hypothetical protein
MTTALALAGFAALFVVFGAFRLGGRRRCSDCSCSEGSCELEEHEGPDLHGV